MATPSLFDPALAHCPEWKKMVGSYRLRNPPGECSLCGAPAPTRCAGCLRVAYCSADHQVIQVPSVTGTVLVNQT